jgi:hypothetical protein
MVLAKQILKKEKLNEEKANITCFYLPDRFTGIFTLRGGSTE